MLYGKHIKKKMKYYREVKLYDFRFSYYTADQDVLEDAEIQGLANEMSPKGLGINGGKGKVPVPTYCQK